MVEREKLLALMREKVYRPLVEADLVQELAENEAEQPAWRELIAELEREGVIVKTRYQRYGLPEMMNLAVGNVIGNAKGFAFLAVPGREDDIYLAASSLGGAMHGDRVIVRLREQQDGRKAEGEVIRILERANQRVVGRFEGGEHIGFCIPDDRRIGQDVVITPGATMGAESGDKIVVSITQWPEGRHAATGRVEAVLGKTGDPGVDVLAVIHQYDLPQEFPDAVKQQLAGMRLEIEEQDLVGRTDLRDQQVVTIDGPDAKDLDDAISLEQLPNGNYRLGVHIADVGHYVRAGSPLDREAFDRGTSVYLLDRVLPMLPPDLSNGICSLNPRVDRLTLSVLMEINSQGRLVDEEIVESVIHSQARMTYGEVNRLLEGETGELAERYAPQIALFQRMKELRDILRDKRARRGAIDFDVAEAKVLLDADGRVTEIVPRTQTVADSIIEEFMVAANEVVAERFEHLELPFIYRVHEVPRLASVQDLNLFLGAFGLRIKVKAENIRPRSFQQVLEQVEGKLEQRLIHRVLLRSMMRARYSPECLGHFGLAAEYYSHFTSPIRRYPDLVIHRIIKEWLHKRQLSPGRQAELTAFVDRAATRSSERERIAADAERTVVDIKKVEYMRGKEGQVFTGVISGVTSFGFFVELENTVEGLVHVSSLDDDYYQFDELAYALIGKRTKRRFRLGDPVQVTVLKVNTEEHKIDFDLATGDQDRN